MKYFGFLIYLLLSGCATTANFWRTDAILTGTSSYDSSRLLYDSPRSSLKLEFLKTQSDIAAYLFLDQHRFIPDPTTPHLTEISFTIDETSFKESLYLREGRMRLKLSTELTNRLIIALQEGKQVTMMTNELTEMIDPGSFEVSFAKFLKGSEPWKFIKGPLE